MPVRMMLGMLLVMVRGATGSAVVVAPLPGQDVVPDGWIAVLRAGATAADHTAVGAAVAAQHAVRIGPDFKAVVFRGAAALAAAAAHPAVKYVEPDAVWRLDAAPARNATAPRRRVPLRCPDRQADPRPQWGQVRVTTERAADVDCVYAHDAQWGAGVDVYILDTGIRCSHEEYRGRCEWGITTSGGVDQDLHGHGTHVAGTVAGTRYGVAKAAHLVAVKVMTDAGGSTTGSVLRGVEWVAARAKAKRDRKSVVNMSIGNALNSPNYVGVIDAINAATREGTLFAVSAGNDNGDTCTKAPAAAESCIAVGSTAQASRDGAQIDARSSFSNYGGCTDVFAPGSGITAAYSTSDTAYSTMSGTSMASPHVAGVAAAYMGANPDVSALDAKAAILDTATKDLINLDCGTSALCLATPNRMLHIACS